MRLAARVRRWTLPTTNSRSPGQATLPRDVSMPTEVDRCRLSILVTCTEDLIRVLRVLARCVPVHHTR